MNECPKASWLVRGSILLLIGLQLPPLGCTSSSTVHVADQDSAAKSDPSEDPPEIDAILKVGMTLDEAASALSITKFESMFGGMCWGVYDGVSETLHGEKVKLHFECDKTGVNLLKAWSVVPKRPDLRSDSSML